MEALAALPSPEPPPDLVNRAVLRAVQRRAARPRRRWAALGRLSLAGGLLAAGALLFVLWTARGERHVPAAAPEPLAESVGRVEASGALVRLVVPAAGARTVAVAGDFNEWRTDDVLLEDPDGDGVFVGTLRLAPGSYAYMFVIDGERWVTDPYAVNHRDDGFGNQNAVLRID
ncbi:MAG: glycogen-binding domain-containing protein [Sandaracinaceae bacterium]|nr:glycogen-binding domain-containing protein [Sandaracinaceae bacterium]